MQFTGGLILDIIIAAIVLLSVIFGARKGFAATAVSFMQWFVCLIIGFLACGKVKGFLDDYTPLGDYVKKSVSDSLNASMADSAAAMSMPDIFSSLTDDGTSNPLTSATAATADAVTSILMTIIAFLVIVIGIKIICFFVMWLFSKKHHDGVTGIIDGFFGFAFGAVRGVIYVFLGFALLVPVLGLFFPDFAATVISAMDTSHVAKYLYNDNVFLIVIKDLFSA